MYESRQLLRNAKLKVTLPRLTVLKILQESDKELTATQIYEYSLNQLGSMSFATIYHILRLLESAGVVNKFRYNNGKALYTLQQQSYAIRINCKNCGQIQKIQNSAINHNILTAINQFDTRQYSLIIQVDDCHHCKLATSKKGRQATKNENKHRLLGNK